ADTDPAAELCPPALDDAPPLTEAPAPLAALGVSAAVPVEAPLEAELRTEAMRPDAGAAATPTWPDGPGAPPDPLNNDVMNTTSRAMITAIPAPWMSVKRSSFAETRRLVGMAIPSRIYGHIEPNDDRVEGLTARWTLIQAGGCALLEVGFDASRDFRNLQRGTGDRHDELLGLSDRVRQIALVEKAEHAGRSPRKPLVAIDKRVVTGERVHQ